MNNIYNTYKNVYLKSLFNESVEELNPPIDDLTKENTTTIDEDAEETKQEEEATQTMDQVQEPEEQETEVNATITAEDDEASDESNNGGEDEDSDESNNDEEDEDSDGWNSSIVESLSFIMEEGESLFYEIKNCKKGVYTNCTTKEELQQYLKDYASQIIEAADGL